MPAQPGQLRLFRNAELSADTLLASACLPTIHRTVVIDGEPYWDGGYSANPGSLSAGLGMFGRRPAAHPAHAVALRRNTREGTGHSRSPARTVVPIPPSCAKFELAHLRANKYHPAACPAGCSTACLRESWNVALSALRFHTISAEHVLGGLPADSKLAVNRPFFEQLRDEGRAHARRWLEQHRPSIGRNASLDLGERVLLSAAPGEEGELQAMNPASPRILSVIPPMTQLNTPYPATAYLTGFLRSRGFHAEQVDLALALVLALLSRQGLPDLKAAAESMPPKQRTRSLKTFLNAIRPLRGRHRPRPLPCSRGATAPSPTASARAPSCPRGRALQRSTSMPTTRVAIRWPGPSAPWACRTAPGTWPRCT